MTWAAPAGLVLAAVSWFIFHGFVYGPDLERLEVWLHGSAPVHQTAQAGPASIDVAHPSATPIFALTTGPGAVVEPQLQLQGLAITPKGRSALLSVDGKPPNWYDLNASRDGITLIEVQSSRVTVDTATRFRDVGLFDKPAASSTPSAGQSSPSPQSASTAFGSPPPTSAPAMSR